MWWLWSMILSGREVERRRLATWAWTGVGVVLTACVFLFSWGIATFPGEWQEEHLSTWRFSPVGDAPEQGNARPSEPKGMSLENWIAPYANWAGLVGNWVLTKEVSLHYSIFNSKVDETTRRRWLPFSNTLVLTGFNVLEGLGIDDPERAKWRDFVFRARGRDLKGARLDFASLPRVDFTGAHLENASLDKAQLDRASFDHAQLQGALLTDGHLQGASLKGAQLRGASLNGAQLQGASLDEARLQGAGLDFAELQGASLNNAQLQGASLIAAQLQGASLTGAELQGASLRGPSFRARRSRGRSFRARRLMPRSFRARRSFVLSFRAHRCRVHA